MTTISEQRREDIAESLRYISGHPPEWATSASVIAELIDVDYPVKWKDSGGLFSMLADLIDRETCRDVSKPDGDFECSECGRYYHADADYLYCVQWEYERPLVFYYCPFCGRKVVHANDQPA